MKPGKKMRMLCLMTAVCLWLFARTSLAEEETLVIVIDPGHGGKIWALSMTDLWRKR